MWVAEGATWVDDGNHNVYAVCMITICFVLYHHYLWTIYARVIWINLYLKYYRGFLYTIHTMESSIKLIVTVLIPCGCWGNMGG